MKIFALLLPFCCVATKGYCVTEPGAGSDVAGIATKAVKKGDEVNRFEVISTR